MAASVEISRLWRSSKTGIIVASPIENTPAAHTVVRTAYCGFLDGIRSPSNMTRTGNGASELAARGKVSCEAGGIEA